MGKWVTLLKGRRSVPMEDVEEVRRKAKGKKVDMGSGMGLSVSFVV